MTAPELLQYLNVLLLPIGAYIVVLERRLSRFELYAEIAREAQLQLARDVRAAHLRLDFAGVPAAARSSAGGPDL